MPADAVQRAALRRAIAVVTAMISSDQSKLENDELYVHTVGTEFREDPRALAGGLVALCGLLLGQLELETGTPRAEFLQRFAPLAAD